MLNRPLTNAGSPALTDSSAPLSETAGTGEQRDLVRALIKQVLITPGRGRQRVDVQEMPDIADPIEIR